MEQRNCVTIAKFKRYKSLTFEKIRRTKAKKFSEGVEGFLITFRFDFIVLLFREIER